MRKFVQKNSLLFPDILWQKPVYAFTRSAGNLLIIGGSGSQNEKALYTADAAFRSGIGFLVLAFPKSLEEIYVKFISKEMMLALPETPSRSLSLKARNEILEFSFSNKITILGPGLSKNSETIQLSFELFIELKNIIIISDDFIRTFITSVKLIHNKDGLGGVKDYFKKLKAKRVIIILKKNQLKELSFLSKEKDITEKLKNISDVLNSEIISIDEDIFYVSRENKILINTIKIEDIKEKDICALTGIIASFVSQNTEKFFEAIGTAIYIFSKVKNKSSDFNLKEISKVIREEE